MSGGAPLDLASALYIHFPFCLRKCCYCDFNSLAGSAITPEAYIDCLIREMELRRALLSGTVSAPTLYFGGGTPSLMEPPLVARIIERSRALFGLEDGAEVTLEANPGTLTPAKLAGYRAAGVNRLSLGVQSFSDSQLLLLGRIHTARQALDAFGAARSAGFDNVSIDLIHSLPGETPEAWGEDLRQAVALAPEHVSAYGLSIEEGTPFHRRESEGKLVLPDEEDGVAMFLQTGAILGAAGYEQYEISSFARPGRRSRHNQVYWQRGNYLGFGAAAHSFLRFPGRGRRWSAVAVPADYCAAVAAGKLPEEDVSLLTERDAMAEVFFLGLRTSEGVDPEAFGREFGRTVDEAYPGVTAGMVGEGFLERRDGSLRLTERGLLVANRVMQKFI
jgi:putative oxygen-independent coproporphyrinogen III oxidase